MTVRSGQFSVIHKKTKQNKTKQNKTKQNKTKQNKTKQNKTKQNKTKQNKTKQKTKQKQKQKQQQKKIVKGQPKNKIFSQGRHFVLLALSTPLLMGFSPYTTPTINNRETLHHLKYSKILKTNTQRGH